MRCHGFGPLGPGRQDQGGLASSGLLAAALALAHLVPAGAEIPEPFPKFTVRPVTEAYPAFARGDPATFSFVATIPAPVDKAWAVMREQGLLVNSMTGCKQIFNLTGSPNDALMVVQWHTPVKWHRWTRTDVRKYVGLDDATMKISYFLVGGFGLWMPRLAFHEALTPGATAQTSTLTVSVWYELDDKYIGWPTHNLKRLTRERWTEFYTQGAWGYAATVGQIANGALARVKAIGRGRIWEARVAVQYLRSEL
mmetsp:Transcript_119543/g.385953  ORF Transcript_119543/g.385953 Transcript_119543/m.385953 type:complete len:253 (+) Transcript_119543:75-833(+)